MLQQWPVAGRHALISSASQNCGPKQPDNQITESQQGTHAYLKPTPNEQTQLQCWHPVSWLPLDQKGGREYPALIGTQKELTNGLYIYVPSVHTEKPALSAESPTQGLRLQSIGRIIRILLLLSRSASSILV